MSESGILEPDERTELILGQIILMVAKGTPHVISLQLLANQLRNQIKGQGLVRTQDPIVLDNFSEPEPDLVLVKGEILDYVDQHPRPSDVLLLVEIADSTLKYDTDTKDKVYAQASIQEYWVIALKNRQIHVFREPTAMGYTQHLILSEPNAIAPLSFPEIMLSLTDLLPPNAGL